VVASSTSGQAARRRVKRGRPSCYLRTVAITDTSAVVDEKQFELYRTLSAAKRVQIAVDLSEAVRRTAIAGIRRRNPDYTDAEVAEALRQLLYGSERNRP